MIAVPSSRSPKVDFATCLTAELRVACAAPFNGLLWGHRRGNRLCVESWSPCGETGEQLETAFRRALRKGPPAAGLQCLGWVCSRDHREARLTEADRALFESCFPESWQAALVIRPGFQRPPQAAVYYRNSPSARPVQEFFLLAPTAGPLLVPPPASRRVRFSPWTAVALVLTGLLVGNALASSGARTPPPAREPLRIIARGADWEIRWDRRGLEQAREPRLEVSQSKKTEARRLSDVEMLAGLVRVPATAGDLEVALIFGPVEDRVLVVGKPATKRKR
jgi:hypothetical protein